MEKKVLELKPVEDAQIVIQGNIIKVQRYLTLENAITFTQTYVSAYFAPDTNLTAGSQFDRIGAEYSLILAVIDTCTDILVNQGKDEVLSVNDLLNTGIWDEVRKAISNYDDFRKDLDATISDIKEQFALAKSLGSVIEGVVTKFENFVDKILETDISPESLNTLKEVTNTFVNGLKDSPASAIMEEATKKTRVRKKKE